MHEAEGPAATGPGPRPASVRLFPARSDEAPIGSTRLGTVVVISGAAALAVEIAASRLLAPFFGSSTIVWANIIGLILIYLSAGYWLGGRFADRHPSRPALGWILLLAALCVAALPFVSRPFLSWALHALNQLSAGAVVASFFTTLLLFALPVTLLGMVSPFAIRLALRDVQSAGTVAGRLYALSTVGSIAGTFLPALVTIPLVGTQRTLLGSALLLTLAAALLLGVRALAVTLLVALLMTLPPAIVKAQAGLLLEQESQYQFVQVVQYPSGERDLELNEGIAVHSVWRADTVLTGGEWDMFLAVPPLIDHPVRNVLIIGNAGGTVARAFGHYYPDAHIDGVEIDPAVTAAGREYMGLNDNPNVTIYNEDGRPFLELADQKYDLIIVDAYRQPYIPFQLATEEFMQLCRDHLTPGGMLGLDVERTPGDDTLPRTIESTVSAVMPDAWSWPALHFNELVLAVNSDTIARPVRHRAMASDIAVLGDLFSAQAARADTSETPMTDDRAPVEWLTDRSLLEFIAGGGRFNEQLLPTAPGRR